MLGIRSEPTKSRPVVTKPQRAGPQLLPKEKKVDRKVFLPEPQWDALARAAEFHEEAFKFLDRNESVSRNDIVQTFLKWALEEYWAGFGGEPTSATDRQRKVELLAERILKDEAGQASKPSNGR